MKAVQSLPRNPRAGYVVSREGAVEHALTTGRRYVRAGMSPRDGWWPALAILTREERASVRETLASEAAA